MAHFTAVLMLYLLSLATPSAGSKLLQAAGILEKQDAFSLRGAVAMQSQGGSECGTIGAPEAQDASVELETLPFSQRKPLFTDLIEHDLSDYRLSWHVLQARWGEAWHSDLPCSKPRHGGMVPKMGTGSQIPTMTIGHHTEQYISEDFPVYDSCYVCSLYYGLVYVCRGASSDNSSLTDVLQQLHRHGRTCSRSACVDMDE